MKRFLYGLGALFFALTLLHGAAYGAVGRAIAVIGNRAIGSAGVAVLTLILFVIAYVLIVPKRVRRWLTKFSTGRGRDTALLADSVVTPRSRLPNGELPTRRGRRQAGHPFARRDYPFQQIVVVGAPAPALHDYEEPARNTAPSRKRAPVIEATVATPPPAVAGARSAADRMRLTDVETALKNLGYRKDEYGFVGAMDPTRPLEELVREALKKLRKS